jgi:AsmA-like C-terminal region/AsmA family
VKRLTLWALGVVAAVAVLAAAATITLPTVVDTPRVQSLIASSASHALGRPVHFTSVAVTVFPLPAVELHSLAVADDSRFAAEPFLKLDRGDVRLRLWPLVTGRVEFGDVVLKKPSITVIQDPAGRWNFASLGATSDPKAPASRPSPSDTTEGTRAGGSAAGGAGVLGSRVKIDGGVVTYLARRAGGTTADYRIEDLNLTLTPNGTSVGFQGGARVEPGDLAVKIADGAVALDGARSLAEAGLRGRLSLDGKDIKDLIRAAAGPTPAVSAALKGTLGLGGSVGSPRASGDVELANVVVTRTTAGCPAPKQRTLKPGSVKMTVTWQDGTVVARPLSTSLGTGTLTTALTAAMDRGARVQLQDLAIKQMPLEPVLVDFLCQGYAVTGPLDLEATLTASARDLWSTLSGPGKFRIGRGKVVGSQALAILGNVARLGGAVSAVLSADVPPALFTSPLDFDSITGTFEARNGVVTTRDLLYTSTLMKVAVAGDYALGSGHMNFDVVVNHGRGEVQAKVTGTAASPSIRVVPSSVVQGIDRGRVESGLQELLRRFR